MASITFRKSTKYGTEPYAILTVTQKSQNIAENYSIIAYSLDLYRPMKVSSSANKSYSITINESTVKSGTYAIGGSGTKTIASGTTIVAHNSDGAKTLSFSASVQFGVTWSGTPIGTISNSGIIKLTAISTVEDEEAAAKAKMPSVLNLAGNAMLGGFTEMSIYSYTQWNYHKVVVSSGDYSYTYPDMFFSGGTIEFPEDRYGEWLGDKENIELTFTITTYLHGAVIGETTDIMTLFNTKKIESLDNKCVYVYDGAKWNPYYGIIYTNNAAID